MPWYHPKGDEVQVSRTPTELEATSSGLTPYLAIADVRVVHGDRLEDIAKLLDSRALLSQKRARE